MRAESSILAFRDVRLWPFASQLLKVEPGTTPAQDVTLTYATVDALAAACGASRLDGGMHFTGAVEAGEALCAGIGTAGFEYASDLIGGEW